MDNSALSIKETNSPEISFESSPELFGRVSFAAFLVGFAVLVGSNLDFCVVGLGDDVVVVVVLFIALIVVVSKTVALVPFKELVVLVLGSAVVVLFDEAIAVGLAVIGATVVLGILALRVVWFEVLVGGATSKEPPPGFIVVP